MPWFTIEPAVPRSAADAVVPLPLITLNRSVARYRDARPCTSPFVAVGTRPVVTASKVPAPCDTVGFWYRLENALDTS